MEVRDDVEVHQGPRRRPLQYSLRSMFVVTTAAAIGLSLVVASPDWLLVLLSAILALAIPMVLTVALIYGRGRLRTFAIGALFPAGAVVVIMFTEGPPFFGMRSALVGLELERRFFLMFFLVGAGAVSVAFGFLAVWVRRMVETHMRQGRGESDPPADAPIDVAETRPGAGTADG